MNDRIRELVEQATIKEDYYPAGCNGHPDQRYYFDKEKFAELIVRECSKVIVNGGYRNPAFGEKHSLTPPEIAIMIKEHFGVDTRN
jgi:hypothetical protein